MVYIKSNSIDKNTFFGNEKEERGPATVTGGFLSRALANSVGGPSWEALGVNDGF